MKNKQNLREDQYNQTDSNSSSRRKFLQTLGMGAAALSLHQISCSSSRQISQKANAMDQVNLSDIPGFEKTEVDPHVSDGWTPTSDRKVKIGLIGHGICKFAVLFGFQDHPNVEVVAVSDLFPDRCAEMARIARCNKTYPSLEELVKDPEIEAVYIATDAPSHAKHAILALEHGKHVACAVPAVWGSLEDADRLYEAWKKSGKKYMLFETSAFHDGVYIMRELYKRDYFGRLVYTEGEYYHYFGTPLGGYNNWREGLVPQWYPTHANAYYTCVTGQSFTEVSCLGMPSILDQFQAKNNVYKNPFGTEIAMYRTAEGGMSRMAVSWDTPGFGAEHGRIRGEKGSFSGKYQGLKTDVPAVKKPPLPPGVSPGGHGGSHGYLTDEFIMAILQDRHPLINIAVGLNLTVPGIVAHQSALKGGELLKIPQYKI